MQSGYFFSQDMDSLATGERSKFRYLPIHSEDQYPVFIHIQSQELGFYFFHPIKRIQIPLFRLHFSDHEEVGGKLTRELQKLVRQKGYPISRMEAQTREKASIHRYLSLAKHLDPTLSSHSSAISTPLLLLDFLFDLQHSNLFQHSPHYDRLRTVIRKNTLWGAILSKAEYVYQRGLFLADQQENPDSPNPITRDYYREAEKKWLNLLTGKETGPVISGSGWFAENLEEEVNEVLWPGENPASWNGKITYRPKRLKSWWQGIFKNEAPQAAAPTKQDKELFGNIANWYLNRYNYREAISLLDDFHPVNRIMISLPSMGAFTLILSGLAWVLGYHILAAALPLGLLTFAVGALMTKDRPIIYLIERVSFLNVANYFSPRLIMTLILAWFAYLKFGKDLSIETRLVLFYYFISITIIPVYLYRTILTGAPDLPFPAAFGRVFRVWIKVFWATLLIGGFVLTLSIWDMDPLEKEYSISLFDSFHLYPFLLFKTAPIVFFSALFVNLLFKDKRVTGF